MSSEEEAESEDIESHDWSAGSVSTGSGRDFSQPVVQTVPAQTQTEETKPRVQNSATQVSPAAHRVSISATPKTDTVGTQTARKKTQTQETQTVQTNHMGKTHLATTPSQDSRLRIREYFIRSFIVLRRWTTYLVSK